MSDLDSRGSYCMDIGNAALICDYEVLVVGVLVVSAA